MAAWPVSLPQAPLIDGWSETLSDNRYSFAPRQGRPMLRKKQTQRLDTQPVRFKFDLTQYATFMTFWTSTINEGVNSFTFNHPLTGVSYSFQFVGDPPQFSAPAHNIVSMSATLMRVS